MALDLSCRLHYHTNSIEYFKLKPSTIIWNISEQEVEDISACMMKDTLFAVNIIIDYLDFTDCGFQIELVASAADKMRIDLYLAIEIPKQKTINYDMNGGNGPILMFRSSCNPVLKLTTITSTLQQWAIKVRG